VGWFVGCGGWLLALVAGVGCCYCTVLYCQQYISVISKAQNRGRTSPMFYLGVEDAISSAALRHEVAFLMLTTLSP
jgi:hypothetical protein